MTSMLALFNRIEEMLALAATFEQIDRPFFSEVKKHPEEIQRIGAKRFLKEDEAPLAIGDP